ncbi:mechanosensitive ion channel family protein [Amorphus orientalis]|uniref:Small-conductance mechanosensitive channel n=1 Tax=Amorphus orientalis TaxID=649198 RepID=A0AAE3VRC0_9HYPH|nr:mechanosensitive ion channel family protein [Amorphus orientalis]MDQ0316922.1 small-conductance mechanosensitive channel [Amorphus orientalis]
MTADRVFPPGWFRVLAALALFVIMAAATTAAAQPEWTGNWDTRWPDGGARMLLSQDGDRVTGEYPLYSGRIEGTVDGRRLVGRWEEPDESGTFVFVLSEDGDSFMGRLGPDLWWTGTRVSDALVETNISQATPADTLRGFLIASEAVGNGQLEYLDNALGLLSFGDADLSRTDEISEATLMTLILGEFEIHLETIRRRTPDDDRMTVTLTRYDGRTFDLTFVRKQDAWYILVPPPEELQRTLRDLLEETGGRVPPANHIFELRTPRDTMEAFIDSMRAGPGGLDTAIATLDTSELNPVGLDREATLIAQYLEQVLARLGEVVLAEIPNDPESQTSYIHFTHPSGDIVIAPLLTDDGVKWKFTPETLRTIRNLFTATEDMPETDVVLPLYRPAQAVFFHIRSFLGSLAPALLSPLGPLEIWQWGAMVAVFGLALLGAVLVSLLLVAIDWFASRDDEDQTDLGFTASRFAVWGVRLLVFGAIGYGGLQLLGLPDSYAGVVQAIALSSLILGLIPIEFWVIDSLRRMLDRAGLITERGDILATLLVGVLKVAIVLGNLLLLAEALNIPYGAALAGVGIGGLAVALAARSTLENVIAGFILFADRPLAVGDFCSFGNQLGTVERIGIRSTMVRTLGRTLVAVPNADFVNMHLENYTRRDQILLRKTISLRHDTRPDQLRYVLTEIRRLLIAHPKVLEEPARARFLGFGNHAIEIEIFAYIRTTDWSEFLAIGEDIMLRLMEVVEQSGTYFAVPTRTLQLGRDPGPDAERAQASEAAVASWREQEELPFPNFTLEEIERLRATIAYPPEGAPRFVDQVPEGQIKSRRARRTFWSFARGGDKAGGDKAKPSS